MKRLALFGDSLFGQVGKPRVLMLEKELKNEYDVYNCAAGGWDTNDLVRKSDYIASLKPDVMVLSVGTNDVAPWKRVELSTFKENLPKILKTFKDCKVVYFLPPPVTETWNSPEEKIFNNDVKQYHDAAKAICDELNVDYVDSWAIFMPLQKKGEVYHVEDGVHLNDHGYEILWSEVARILS